MIIFDENIDQVIIDLLSADDDIKTGFLSIRNETPGITDREVISLAKEQKGILITEDKDFGELVFSHNMTGCSVGLLRYEKEETPAIAGHLKKVIKKT